MSFISILNFIIYILDSFSMSDLFFIHYDKDFFILVSS